MASHVDDFLEEVQDDEFPEYFIQRDDRLYHSHSTCPYPLPIDAPEQQVWFDVYQLSS